MSDQNFKITPIENALDFIASALGYLGEQNSNSDIKYSILHLSAGIELILKEILRKEHWALIFQNVDKANRAAYEAGDFQGVNFETCIKRLEGISSLALQKEKTKLSTFRDKRNKLEHFGIQDSIEAIKSSTAESLAIVLNLIHKHFDEESFQDSEKELLTKIRGDLSEFETFVQKRMEEVNKILKDDFSFSEILVCPTCFQDALIIDDGAKCLFCNYNNSGDSASEEWVEKILETNRYLTIKDGGYFPIEFCPECGSESLVYGINNFKSEFDANYDHICFTCGSNWERGELDFCMRCSRVINSELELCEYCEDELMEKD